MSYYGYAYQRDTYSYPSHHHYGCPNRGQSYGDMRGYARQQEQPRDRGYSSYSDRAGFGELGRPSNPFNGMGDRFNGARHRFGGAMSGAMRGAGRQISDFGQVTRGRGASCLSYMQDRYNGARGRNRSWPKYA